MCKSKGIAVAPCYELKNYLDWLERLEIKNYRILKPDDNLEVDEMLMICGGPDYGKNHDRDVNEIKWIKQAIQNECYIAGICRGLQIINIVLGGTLIEDISTNITHTSVGHKEESNYHEAILLNESIRVNSRHHQAIDKLADGLIVSCSSDDGIVEAVYTDQMCLVQWHPEREEVFNTPCERYISDWIKQNLY